MSGTGPREGIRRALITLFTSELQAAVARLAGNPVALQLTQAFADSAPSEFEGRNPVLLLLNDAMAESIGATCLTWPGSEGQRALDRSVSTMRKIFVEKADEIRARLAETDPMLAFAYKAAGKEAST
jgi:hypothetical protein